MLSFIRRIFRRNKKITSVTYPADTCCDNNCRTMSPSDIYSKIPIFRSAIDLIAKSCGSVGVNIYDGNKIVNNPFLSSPNPNQSWTSFISESVTHKLIYGVNIIKYYNGSIYNVNPNDEIYGDIIKRIIPDPEFPDQPLSLLNTASLIASRAYENLLASSRIIKNGGMAGILSVNIQNDYASNKIIENARQELRNEFSGGFNYGKLAIVGYPMTYSKVSLNAQELGIIDFYKFDLVDVARVFGIPSVLLSDNEASTYNNVYEAERRFYRNTIIPELDDLFYSINILINEKFQLRGIKGKLGYDTSNILALQDDITTYIDNIVKLYNSGIITIDEARSKINIL